MKRRMQNCFLAASGIVAVITIAFGVYPTSGKSTMTQVTKANLDSHPFVFEIDPEDKQNDEIWFQVFVSPKNDREEWCVSAGLVITHKGRRVCAVSLANETYQDQWRWTYSFTITREYLRTARFTFYDSSCVMPSLDGYFFDLATFYEE